MERKTALIATLPKSGTWYAHTFFWCYDQLLQRADAYLAGEFKIDLVTALNNKDISNLSTHSKTLGLDQLFICHSICPGFTGIGDIRAGLWQALCFPLPYNWGETFVRNYGSWEKLDPAKNPEARIVYLCRNPLDHFVSYYRHAQGHIDASHRTKTLPDGMQAPIKDLQDFVFNAGMLGAFIRHYYSFRQMQERYPRQVRIVPYEQLTMEPARSFTDILTFLDAPPEGPLKTRLFKDALTLCSKESLMAVESRLKDSLAGDQKRGEKHIRGGEIGKWVKYFSEADLEKIQAAFRLFGFSLLDFDLFGNSSDKRDLSWLSAIEPSKLQAHQIAFLEQELTLAGIRLGSAQPAAEVGGEWLKHTKARLLNLLRRSPIGPSLRNLKHRVRARSSQVAR